MKKPAIGILVLVTCIFVSFTAGFWAGRSLNRAPVRISQPTRPAVAQPPSETGTAPTGPVIVNINTATAAELEALPGIGPVLAQRIVAYREENGSFQTPEELIKVKGLGAATLEAILDQITAGGNG